MSAWDEKGKIKPEGGRAGLDAYLQGQATKLGSLGFQIETEVRDGKAAEVCLAAASAGDVDLVLIATHGRTGLARLRLGSVADKVIKDSPCPTLVVGPNVDIDLSTYSLKRILVPLDGTDLSELALPIARHMARLTGAQIDLVRCIQLTGMVQDPMMASADLLTVIEEDAESYLAKTAADLEAEGFKVSSTLMRGAPAELLLDYLKENEIDLVIMASNGRTGLLRSAMGSVAERVLHGPDPVLVFEPHEDRSKLFDTARTAS